MKQNLSLCWLCVAMIFLWSCSNTKKLTQTDLYFGMLQSNGNQISDSAWTVFVREEVSQIFPQGFTIISAEGHWQDQQTGKTFTEPSHVVIHIGQMKGTLSSRIDSLREKYKSTFLQQSVLRVSRKVEARF